MYYGLIKAETHWKEQNSAASSWAIFFFSPTNAETERFFFGLSKLFVCKLNVNKILKTTFIIWRAYEGYNTLKVVWIATSKAFLNSSNDVNALGQSKAGFPLVDLFHTNGLFLPLIHHITQ